MPDTFKPGDIAEWQHRDGGPGTAIIVRPVRVERLIDNGRLAIVSFGEDRVEVELAELSRPQPPALLHPVTPILPEPAEPPNLEDHRARLKDAIDRHRQACQTTIRAAETADRAMNALTISQARLRSSIELEDRDVSGLVAALQQNRDNVSTQAASWVATQEMKRGVDLAERAYQKLSADLARCRENERAILDQIHKLAADIVGIIASQEILKLGELEQQAADIRAKLKAVCLWFPASVETQGKPLSLSSQAQAIISNEPVQINDPTGYEVREHLRTQRQQPFVDLFNRLLVDGDATLE